MCTAAVTYRAHGLNGGVAAGRACWAVAGHYSPEPDCDRTREGVRCVECDFYQTVRGEEGAEFVFTADILERLHSLVHSESRR